MDRCQGKAESELLGAKVVGERKEKMVEKERGQISGGQEEEELVWERQG